MGSEAYYVTYVTPVHEADGSIGACLAAVDVTEHRRQGDALREAKPLAEIPYIEENAGVMLEELLWWTLALRHARAS